MVYQVGSPIQRAHRGFYLGINPNLIPIALASFGFFNQLTVTSAKFCLFLLTQRENPLSETLVREVPLASIQARISPIPSIFIRVSPTGVIRQRISPTLELEYRTKPSVVIVVEECD